jgi:hypothetical protein
VRSAIAEEGKQERETEESEEDEQENGKRARGRVYIVTQAARQRHTRSGAAKRPREKDGGSPCNLLWIRGPAKEPHGGTSAVCQGMKTTGCHTQLEPTKHANKPLVLRNAGQVSKSFGVLSHRAGAASLRPPCHSSRNRYRFIASQSVMLSRSVPFLLCLKKCLSYIVDPITSIEEPLVLHDSTQ